MNRAAALLLVLAVCPRAWAESKNEAASAFARGQALHARGDYAAAIAAFERAYELKPHHAVLCSIALCYEQMNRFVEAAARYRRCLSEGAERSAKAASVQRALKAVEARINYVEVKSASGGTVYVDGLARGEAPQRVPLDPGEHLVEVRRAGSAPATATLRLVSGEERTLTLSPVPSAVATRPAQRPKVEPRPAIQDGPVLTRRGPRRLTVFSRGRQRDAVAASVGLRGSF